MKQLSGHCALAFADARSLLAMLPGHAASGFGLDAKTLTVSQFVSAQQADRQASKQAGSRRAGEAARRAGGQALAVRLSVGLTKEPSNRKSRPYSANVTTNEQPCSAGKSPC